MVARGKKAFKKAILRVSAGIFAVGLLTFASLAPASAQGIFERIFGGLRHAVGAPAGLPATIQAFADPFAGTRNAPSQRGRSRPGERLLRAYLRRLLLSGTGACRRERG